MFIYKIKKCSYDAQTYDAEFTEEDEKCVAKKGNVFLKINSGPEYGLL